MLSIASTVLIAVFTTGCPAPGVAPRPSADLSLTLNLPAFRLDVYDGGRRVHSYTVAVGSRRYRTPTGRFRVFAAELNPWWHPPASPWARKEKVTPPGPANPMGRAKLNFHELYFLHGTPQAHSLGSAASHGCVRMANDDAVDLARRVLAAARPDLSVTVIEAALADRHRTRRYELAPGIPLEIRYLTAEVRDGALELHPDVYGRETTRLRDRALEALTGAGVDPLSIDPARLDSAARAGRRRHVRVPLDTLLLVRPRSAAPGSEPAPASEPASIAAAEPGLPAPVGAGRSIRTAAHALPSKGESRWIR